MKHLPLSVATPTTGAFAYLLTADGLWALSLGVWLIFAALCFAASVAAVAPPK